MGKLNWCTKYDIEILEDMVYPEACWLAGMECRGCRFHVFETKNEIRARKALEAGRKQPTLFGVIRKSEEGEK